MKPDSRWLVCGMCSALALVLLPSVAFAQMGGQGGQQCSDIQMLQHKCGEQQTKKSDKQSDKQAKHESKYPNATRKEPAKTGVSAKDGKSLNEGLQAANSGDTATALKDLQPIADSGSNAYAKARIAAGEPGQIVLVGSLSGLAASPGTRMYNATKFGLRGFSLSFSQELEGTGVGCSLVAPGFIRDAGMFHKGGIDLPPGVRTKSPQDVADGVVTAITHSPAEVFVAPVELRLASTLATVAPALSATIQKKLDVANRR